MRIEELFGRPQACTCDMCMRQQVYRDRLESVVHSTGQWPLLNTITKDIGHRMNNADGKNPLYNFPDEFTAASTLALLFNAAYGIAVPIPHMADRILDLMRDLCREEVIQLSLVGMDYYDLIPGIETHKLKGEDEG